VKLKKLKIVVDQKHMEEAKIPREGGLKIKCF